MSPIASPDGLGTSPASWTSPSPSPAFPFDPFHPSPSSQEAPLLLQRFSALGSLGSLQMSIPRTPGGRENQGSSGQPRSSRLLALPKGLVSFLIVLTNTRQKNLKGYLFFATKNIAHYGVKACWHAGGCLLASGQSGKYLSFSYTPAHRKTIFARPESAMPWALVNLITLADRINPPSQPSSRLRQ